MRLPRTMVSTAWLQLIPIAISEAANVHVAALIAVPTQKARKVPDPHVRARGEIGRKSGLMSPGETFVEIDISSSLLTTQIRG